MLLRNLRMHRIFTNTSMQKKSMITNREAVKPFILALFVDIAFLTCFSAISNPSIEAVSSGPNWEHKCTYNTSVTPVIACLIFYNFIVVCSAIFYSFKCRHIVVQNNAFNESSYVNIRSYIMSFLIIALGCFAFFMPPFFLSNFIVKSIVAISAAFVNNVSVASSVM
ncbi:hypothetical protein O9G_001134 [Rozella allomycis CSF55]|uniref:G-protein coupled receptors family 3 profile domain-containing protein n=1 Tax=Rozella allomycis (strain CSF55) TaxID=988480 RepID=A0A075ASN8_ROZAC|nr:hypothetical protein O9G_001134 [Rozella allomycis CSF55]|eukprot:EPZ33165.1 hypothetical protein O9G_001134 [Rozella allomycis CSF55]